MAPVLSVNVACTVAVGRGPNVTVLVATSGRAGVGTGALGGTLRGAAGMLGAAGGSGMAGATLRDASFVLGTSCGGSVADGGGDV